MTDLGMRWGDSGKGVATVPKPQQQVNTRSSLWPERWPAIAKQECIDKVEAAPPGEQAEVKFLLPCATCELQTACLNAKQKELGPLMYSREILTRPRTSESSLFPREVFEPGLIKSEVLVPFWRPPFSMEHEYVVAQAWDLAWSETIGGDWLVCMTAFLHKPTGRRHLLDIERWQRVSFDDQIRLVQTKAAPYSPDIVVMESDAAQSIWSKKVAAKTSLPVVPHSAGGKTDLAHGVPGLLILLANRKWTFPYGPKGTYHRENVDVFLDEAEAFGWVDGKLQGVGEHDDTVMCWWHLNWAIDKFVGMAGGETHRGVVPGARA